jgi:signal transduction histidine kinase
MTDPYAHDHERVPDEHVPRPATYFDTPERTGQDEIRRLADGIASHPLVKDLLAAYPMATVMLDENRQIVAFNDPCLRYFNGHDRTGLYGLRFGEALQCVHAHHMDAGCGTSPFCRHCGAAAAIRSAREGNRAALECRISAVREGQTSAFDFRVHTSLFTLEGQSFVLAVIEDIADEKRRHALEQIFFHDILNTAGVINQAVHVLRTGKAPGLVANVLGALTRSSSQLLDEIRAQRDLTSAERGELVVTSQRVFASWIWSAIHEIYAVSPLAEGKQLVVEPLDPDVLVSTDRVHAVRCLGNLVKNALEASPTGGRVRLWSDVQDGMVAFHVQNGGLLSEPVRRQMFQRSFSTKGTQGRGIGTYSVRLLVEQYLGGSVTFTSDPEHQTVFTIALPRAPAR